MHRVKVFLKMFLIAAMTSAEAELTLMTHRQLDFFFPLIAIPWPHQQAQRLPFAGKYCLERCAAVQTRQSSSEGNAAVYIVSKTLYSVQADAQGRSAVVCGATRGASL